MIAAQYAVFHRTAEEHSSRRGGPPARWNDSGIRGDSEDEVLTAWRARPATEREWQETEVRLVPVIWPPETKPLWLDIEPPSTPRFTAHAVAFVDVSANPPVIRRVEVLSEPAGDVPADHGVMTTLDVAQGEGATYGEAVAELEHLLDGPAYAWVRALQRAELKPGAVYDLPTGESASFEGAANAHALPLIGKFLALAGRFDGVTLECRKSAPRSGGWTGPWRARVVTSKNERAEFRFVRYGETAEDAAGSALRAVAEHDAGYRSAEMVPRDDDRDLVPALAAPSEHEQRVNAGADDSGPPVDAPGSPVWVKGSHTLRFQEDQRMSGERVRWECSCGQGSAWFADPDGRITGSSGRRRAEASAESHLQMLGNGPGAAAIMVAFGEPGADREMASRCGINAIRWAEEFHRLHGGDRPLLTAWFAVAIQAALDRARKAGTGAALWGEHGFSESADLEERALNRDIINRHIRDLDKVQHDVFDLRKAVRSAMKVPASVSDLDLPAWLAEVAALANRALLAEDALADLRKCVRAVTQTEDADVKDGDLPAWLYRWSREQDRAPMVGARSFRTAIARAAGMPWDATAENIAAVVERLGARAALAGDLCAAVRSTLRTPAGVADADLPAWVTGFAGDLDRMEADALNCAGYRDAIAGGAILLTGTEADAYRAFQAASLAFEDAHRALQQRQGEHLGVVQQLGRAAAAAARGARGGSP